MHRTLRIYAFRQHFKEEKNPYKKTPNCSPALIVTTKKNLNFPVLASFLIRKIQALRVLYAQKR